MTLDLQNVGFDQALTALAAAGRTFHRVVDAKVLNVVPDTASKRREFEQQVVKTLFLSNADLKETIDLLRVVLGARRIAPVPGSNALTINDTPDKVAAAERIVEIVDKRRAEVVVEVQILEVARNKLKEYGIYLTSGLDAQGIEGIASGVFPDPRITNPSDGPYDRDNLVVTSLPGAVLRLLETDSSTRLLANPQLRTSEGQTAQARFGDQVPVPVTTFTAIATGGTPAAADHLVRVQERRREHRHHAARAPGRRGDAAAQARHLGGRRARLPGPAHLQQPHGQLDDPAARRRDQHAGGPDPRQRAARAHRASRGSRASRSSAGCSPRTRTRPARPTS